MTLLEVVSNDVIKLNFFFYFTFGLVKMFLESLNSSLKLKNFTATLLASSTMMKSHK